jgi:hypothetical protein
MRSSSPLWSGSQPGNSSNPSSPLFPTFHNQHRSPSGDAQFGSEEGDDLEQADMSLEMQPTGNSDPSEELDQLGDEVMSGHLTAHDSLNPRLSRISVSLPWPCLTPFSLTEKTESSASLRTSHDKLQILQKQNADLARKLKEGEKQLAIIG